MRITIDSNLLPMKGHYFLFNAGVAPIQPFMTVIAKDLNFSSTAVGIINAALPFFGMIAKPTFGALADRFKLHKFVFVSFQVLTVIGFFNVQFVPAIEGQTDGTVSMTCGAESNIEVCYKQPDKESECLIQDILADSNSNRTIKCSMKCDLSPELRTELCGPWRADPKICSDEFATGPSGVEYTHYEDGGSSRHLKYPETLDDAKLEFEATVPLKHTLKVADCLYFLVADAKMNDERHHVPYCNQVIDTKCRISCDYPKVMELVKRQCSQCDTEDNQENGNYFLYYYQFWVFLILAILSWIGMAVVGSVADAVCFHMLGEQTHLYGYQRLWGSVGWGLFTILSGIIVDKFSLPGKTNYTPAYYIMLVVIVSDIVCTLSLKYEQTKVSCNMLKNIGGLLKNIWINLFLVWCVVMGMCVGVQWTFLFWHLDKLGGCENQSTKQTLLGLVGGVQCFLGELPSLFLFSWLVKKLGHVHIMSLIPFTVGIRFILYSVLLNPWWVLPIEVLQASVGLTFASMASYASSLAPSGAEATIQGLVGAIFEGVGVSLGSYLGGIIFEAYGGGAMFRIFAVIAFALCLIHGTVHYLLGQHQKRHFNAAGVNGVAKYATPNEEVAMLEDTRPEKRGALTDHQSSDRKRDLGRPVDGDMKRKN